MGWTGDNELWVSTRGGDVLVAPQPGVTEKFDNANVPSRGFGILDVGCAPLREPALLRTPMHPDSGRLNQSSSLKMKVAMLGYTRWI